MTGWQEAAAERDAEMLRWRQEREWLAEQASKDPHGWAATARNLLAAASPVAAKVIEHGLGRGIRCWQLEELARAQVAESRAERAVIDGLVPDPVAVSDR